MLTVKPSLLLAQPSHVGCQTARHASPGGRGQARELMVPWLDPACLMAGCATVLTGTMAYTPNPMHKINNFRTIQEAAETHTHNLVKSCQRDTLQLATSRGDSVQEAHAKVLGSQRQGGFEGLCASLSGTWGSVAESWLHP